MICKYCNTERKDYLFYTITYRGKTYKRKKCSICISKDKAEFYKKRKELELI